MGNLKFLSLFDSCQRVPESARLGNALDTTRHVSIVEVLGVFMLYFALHQVNVRRSVAFVNCWLSVFPQRTFGRSKAYGSYAPRTRPHHTQGLARGGDWQSETLPSTLALPTCTSCFRVKFLRWRFSDQSLCQS